MTTPPADTPIVCTAPADGGPEGIAEYQRLFAAALVGRERTVEGIRFRFHDTDGIEAWVRDLADREKACCAFFAFTITSAGGEVLWDATVVDDPIARDVLDEFYALPDTVTQGVDELRRRFAERGLTFSPGSGPTTPGAAPEARPGAPDA